MKLIYTPTCFSDKSLRPYFYNQRFTFCFSDSSDLLDDTGDDAKSVRTNDDSKK